MIALISWSFSTSTVAATPHTRIMTLLSDLGNTAQEVEQDL